MYREYEKQTTTGGQMLPVSQPYTQMPVHSGHPCHVTCTTSATFPELLDPW